LRTYYQIQIQIILLRSYTPGNGIPRITA